MSRAGARVALRFDYMPEFRKAEWAQGAIHSAELMFTFDTIATSGWSGGRRQTPMRRMRIYELLLGCLQDAGRCRGTSVCGRLLMASLFGGNRRDGEVW